MLRIATQEQQQKACTAMHDKACGWQLMSNLADRYRLLVLFSFCFCPLFCNGNTA